MPKKSFASLENKYADEEKRANSILFIIIGIY